MFFIVVLMKYKCKIKNFKIFVYSRKYVFKKEKIYDVFGQDSEYESVVFFIYV